MIRKISPQELRNILSNTITGISDNDRDEMAIPSYLHWNPLIRWLMWRRYEYISYLSGFSPEMFVLEFGCGTGVFLPELATKCNHVYAIDLFPEYAKCLCKKLNLNVLFRANLAELEDASLDVIIAADVLEHLNDTELDEYLLMFSKKLKSNGRLIVSGPTENIIYKMGRTLAGFADKGDYHHTDINVLIDTINGHFDLKRMKSLPFLFPPYLFKVCEFKQSQTKCLQ